MDNEKHIETLKAKATGYNIFSALLCQPEADLLDKAEVYDKLIDSYKTLSPEKTDDFIALKEWVKEYSPQKLLVEYTRLFIGPGKMPVPPYAGLYFNGKHLMDDDTLWVINFYSSNGLEFDSELKDGPDHIAVETEFMYYLLFNEIKENGERARMFEHSRMEFLSKHYLKWVPRFCDKILENTFNEYYRTLALCLKKFVVLETNRKI